MSRLVTALRFGASAAVLGLAACSGGGSSSLPLPTNAIQTTPAPLPTASASATTATASGFVFDLPYDATAKAPGYSVLANTIAATPGTPIAGADVYIGNALVLGATAPQTVPAAVAHAVSGANGSFSIVGLAPGTYAMTIFAPAPHVAVLHRDVVVGPAAPSGVYLMTAPTAAETAWLAQQTIDRSNFGIPPVTLDEAALEAARYWASFMARNAYFSHCVPATLCEAGDTTPAPASFGPQDVDPEHRFAYFHGFSGAAQAENIAAGFATWQSVNSAFMQEQSICPHASPTDCPFTGATGHFLNIIDARYAWTGVAIATSPSGVPFYDEEFSLVSSTMPTAARATALHRDVRGRTP